MRRVKAQPQFSQKLVHVFACKGDRTSEKFFMAGSFCPRDKEQAAKEKISPMGPQMESKMAGILTLPSISKTKQKFPSSSVRYP